MGFAVLTGLDAMSIANNPHSLLMTDLRSSTSRHIEPEGHYLVGYPREMGTVSRESYSEAKVLNSYANTLVCLPMEKIVELKDDWPSNFRGEGDTFFGQIVEFLEGWQGQPRSIVGMSGGPVFAIARHPSNKFVCELIGIQSGWLPKSRVIRAEPIGRALGFVEQTLAK